MAWRYPPAVQVRVLGGLRVQVSPGEGPVHLGGPRQRSVLAMLLTARGNIVSVDRLVDGVWNGRPPRSPVGTLQSYVSHLRRTLEPQRSPRSPATVLRSEAPGYAIRLPVERVDAWHFEALIESASTFSDPAVVSAELRRALSLWHGDAYAEFADHSWATAEIAHLMGLRAVAIERLCRALLAEGRPEEAVLQAERLLHADPLREEAWRLSALSLYAAGRQADALAALRRARTRLRADVGLDPHPTLLSLEADILGRRVDLQHQLPTGRTVPPASVVSEPQAAEAELPQRQRLTSDQDLIGRTAELQAIHAVAQEAADRSQLATVLVTGDAGAGKSMLLAHAVVDLAANGWLVATGRCADELAGAPPGSAWAEALRSLGRRWVLDAAASPDPSVGRHHAIQGAVHDLLATARRQRLAIVLEDVHRADSLVAALTPVLLHGATQVPLLLLLSCRPGEHSAFSDELLSAVAPTLPTRVALAELAMPDVGKLVASVSGVVPSADTVRALVERTAGNAYFLVECARLLRSEGADAAVSGVPEGVSDVLRHRLRRLGPAHSDVLRLAAVIGLDVDLDVLVRSAATVGLLGGAERVVAAVEVGLTHRLLFDAAPGVFRFMHELAREAVLRDVPAPRRAAWHAAVAAAISDVHPQDVAAVAHHLIASGTAVGARAAMSAATAAAAEAMAQYAPEAAVALYRQALEALHRLDVREGGAERAELLSKLSVAELATGSGAAALATRSAAVRIAERSGDADALVRTLVTWDLPSLWTVRPYGTSDPGLVALHRQALLKPGLTDGERCRLLCSLVREDAGNDLVGALAASTEAEMLGRRSGDPVLLGLALHARGVALLHDSDLTSRLGPAAELVRLGERPGLPLFALIGHEFVAQWAVAYGRTDVLDERVERMQALVQTYGWPQALGAVGMHQAVSAHLRGDVAAAEQRYTDAMKVLRRNGNLDAEQIGGLAAYSLAVSTDRLAAMEPLVRSFEPLPPPAVDLLTLITAAGGRAAEAAAIHARWRVPDRDFFRSLWLTVRGLAVARLARFPGVIDDDELAGAYTDLSEFTDQLGGGVTGAFVFGPVDTVLGDLASHLGPSRTAGAAEHYARAIEVAARCGSPQWRRSAQRSAARLI